MSLFTLLALLVSSPSALAGKAERAQKLATASVEAFNKGDPSKALDKIDKAIALAPEDPELHWMRFSLLVRVCPQLGPDAVEVCDAALEEELVNVARLDPNGPLGNMAAGLLKKSASAGIFPDPTVECSAEAHQLYESAEVAFSGGDFAGARKSYDAALALCPEQPVWWTYAGDAALKVGDTADAITDYEKALGLSPCFWVAHRFLADVQFGQGERDTAYHHLVQSVACNPMYDLAWHDLEALTGAGWRRELSRPPEVSGVVTVTPGQSPEQTALALLNTVLWGPYQTALQSAEGSQLDRHRAGARAGLAAWVGLGANGPAPGVWTIWAEADAAGLLDAALFLTTEDMALLAEYPAWYAGHAGEPERLVREILAPQPAQR